MKHLFRALYLFLMIPLTMMLIDFFWWFYTDKFLSSMDWSDFRRSFFTLGTAFFAGSLFIVTEST